MSNRRTQILGLQLTRRGELALSFVAGITFWGIIIGIHALAETVSGGAL